jgi:hypothetical protein
LHAKSKQTHKLPDLRDRCKMIAKPTRADGITETTCILTGHEGVESEHVSLALVSLRPFCYQSVFCMLAYIQSYALQSEIASRTHFHTKEGEGTRSRGQPDNSSSFCFGLFSCALAITLISTAPRDQNSFALLILHTCLLLAGGTFVLLSTPKRNIYSFHPGEPNSLRPPCPG